MSSLGMPDYGDGFAHDRHDHLDFVVLRILRNGRVRERNNRDVAHHR